MSWADYLITGVRYSADRSHITDLEIRPAGGATIGAPEERTRAAVVRMLESGSTFATARMHGRWVRGADVSVVTIGRDKYLRTNRNQVAADNLGELPELASRLDARRW